MRTRKLSEHMEAFKIDRPSEWLMGEWIGHAKELEDSVESCSKRNETDADRIKELREELFNKTADLETAEANVKALEADYGRLQNDNQKYIDNRIAAQAQLDALRGYLVRLLELPVDTACNHDPHFYTDYFKAESVRNIVNEALGENDD